MAGLEWHVQEYDGETFELPEEERPGLIEIIRNAGAKKFTKTIINPSDPQKKFLKTIFDNFDVDAMQGILKEAFGEHSYQADILYDFYVDKIEIESYKIANQFDIKYLEKRNMNQLPEMFSHLLGTKLKVMMKKKRLQVDETASILAHNADYSSNSIKGKLNLLRSGNAFHTFDQSKNEPSYLKRLQLYASLFSLLDVDPEDKMVLKMKEKLYGFKYPLEGQISIPEELASTKYEKDTIKMMEDLSPFKIKMIHTLTSILYGKRE